MKGDRQALVSDTIIRVVLEILESEGYDAVQPRLVAKRARVSLSTIYKAFPTRDDLIVAALGRWMHEHCYSGLTRPPADASLHEGQMRFFRHFFRPWVRKPRMLEAYHRARMGPGGERLDLQGAAAAEPVASALLLKLDPTYANDVGLILINMVCGLIQRCATGELAAKEILPMLDRTLFRLTANNEPLAVVSAPRRRRARRRRRSPDPH